MYKNLSLFLIFFFFNPTLLQSQDTNCLSKNGWMERKNNDFEFITKKKAYSLIKKNKIIFIGENHESNLDHELQLEIIKFLHLEQNKIILALEMFPQNVQSVLDKWSKGKIDTKKFLQDTNWNNYWGFNINLYLPILEFAKNNDIKMYALNIDHDILRKITKKGFESLDDETKQIIGKPKLPGSDYIDYLKDIFEMHVEINSSNEFKFNNFLDAQLAWDTLFATKISKITKKDQTDKIVALIGKGHLDNKNGVPFQLKNIGQHNSIVIITERGDQNCSKIKDINSDLIFVTEKEN